MQSITTYEYKIFPLFVPALAFAMFSEDLGPNGGDIVPLIDMINCVRLFNQVYWITFPILRTAQNQWQLISN